MHEPLLTTPSLSLLRSQCGSCARGFAIQAAEGAIVSSTSFIRIAFGLRLQEMKSQEDRVSIRVLVASERDLHFRFTQLKRMLLCILHCLHAPRLRIMKGLLEQGAQGGRRRTTPSPCAQVLACLLRQHAGDCSENIESHGLDHLVRKWSAVMVFHLVHVPRQNPWLAPR